MSDAAWVRLIEWGLRLFQAALILLWPKFNFLRQDWALRRDSTLFGVRVPADFGDSQIGRDIFDEYRKRIWMTAIILSGIFAIGAPNGPSVGGLWYLGLFMGMSMASWAFYAMAQRRVRIEANPAPVPSVRTASLIAEEPVQRPGRRFAAWAVMLLPVLLPLITGILLALNWRRYPLRLPLDYTAAALAFTGAFGLCMSALQYALRYHARSSDWAAEPAASLNYRTDLGLMMGSASLGAIAWGCILTLTQLFGIGMGIQFAISYPVMFAVIIFSRRMRSSLVKQFDPQSGDPMADRCWKWAYFYYNSSDPAWVVPTRSGVSCALNHARAIPWICYGITLLAFIAMIAPFSRVLTEISHYEAMIEKSLH
jgi:uncharacterized membrane protein